MFKSVTAAGAAAVSVFSIGFVMAYGASTAASAKAAAFEPPVTVDSKAATPVEIALPVFNDSSSSQAAPTSQTAPDDSPVQPEADDSADDNNTPSAPAPKTLSALVATYDASAPLDPEAKCLATAVFFEARGERLSGQLAVANVVLARARSSRFPDSLCAVVTQHRQFSFVRNGRLPVAPEHRPAWRVAKAIAQIALNKSWTNPVQGALYFHADYVAPNWGRAEVAQIGRHIFYR